MQRSKFDIERADVGAGGMSMTSGSGGASGMGASSSSSDATSGKAAFVAARVASCSGRTGSADVGELLVCERPVNGFSWSQALQAGAWS